MRFMFVAIAVVLSSSLSFANHGGHHHGGGMMHSAPKYWGNSNVGGSHSMHHGSRHVADPSEHRARDKGDASGAQPRGKKKLDPAKEEFMRESGYPDGRPGYAIVYIVSLKKGGLDSPSNMTWKMKEPPKPKDGTESAPPRAPKSPPADDQPRHHHRKGADRG